MNQRHTDRKKRILVFALAPPLPPTSGGTMYVVNSLAPLADRYEFHLFTIGGEDERVQVERHGELYSKVFASVHVEPRARLPSEKGAFGKAVHFITHIWYGLPFIDASFFTRSAVRAARRIVREHGIDAFEIHTAHLAYFKRFFPKIPALLVNHNIETDLFPFWIPSGLQGLSRRVIELVARISRRNAFRVEQRNAWLFEEMTFISEDDMKRVEAPVRKHYIPLCLPVQATEYASKGGDVCNALWLGGFWWYPNLEGVQWFLREIFPLVAPHLDDARLRLHFVGANPPPELQALHDGRTVCVHGFVPSLSKLLADSHLLIVPILSGGGVRVKILEALSHGIPVLTTSKGCEGLGARDGQHLLIRDDPAAFAESLVALAADFALRERLSAGGRALLAEHFDLDHYLAVKDAIYARL
jgi:glycosyltransferase involved in cell wall biosynthesis